MATLVSTSDVTYQQAVSTASSLAEFLVSPQLAILDATSEVKVTSLPDSRKVIAKLPDAELASGLSLPIVSFDELSTAAADGDIATLQLWQHNIADDYARLVVVALRSEKLAPEVKKKTIDYLITL